MKTLNKIRNRSKATGSTRQLFNATLLACALLSACSGGGGGGGGGTSQPRVDTGPAASVGDSALMFVTSVPGAAFDHQLNTFSNHRNTATAGGDLFIRYGDGTLRNLTQEAGFGVPSGQIQDMGAGIAVRQPSMHWNGAKAIFSMQTQTASTKTGDLSYAAASKNKWQMYEVTGLGKGETAVITKVAKQPNYNNVSAIYGSVEGTILFTSDAPLYGMTHTYPQLDEYESAQVISGIWKIDTNSSTGNLTMIQHAPSGVSDLHLDSCGRLLFTKWDHLKRDQQADHDRYDAGQYGPKDFASEAVNAVVTFFSGTQANGKPRADTSGVLYDVFPELNDKKDPTAEQYTNFSGQIVPLEEPNGFNQFIVWQINEDGSEEETINHAGRNEFGGMFMDGVFKNDPLLVFAMGTFSKNPIRDTVRGDAGIFQLREDTSKPGRYYGTYAQEFRRQSAGRIFEFELPPGPPPKTWWCATTPTSLSTTTRLATSH